MNDPALFELFLRLGLALAIGFLVGVERGWKHREDPEETRAAGLRTHAIIGLLGGVSGMIGIHFGAVALAALTLAFIAPFAVFKYREAEADKDLSVTGSIAGLLVFALGVYAAWGDLRVVAAAGVSLTALLAFKRALHGWLHALTWEEIQSALFILAASVIALPLLPDRALDPWGAINLRELWMLTILVAGISFAGYIAVRVLGTELGLLADAAVGALVSSTVVTIELGRSVRAGSAEARPAAGAASLAAAVSLVRVTMLIAIAAAPALPYAAPGLIAAALAFLIATAVLTRFKAGEGAAHSEALTSPLELKSVLLFALLLGGVIALGRIAAKTWGAAGVLPFAATAGIADIDAVALAAGNLIRAGMQAPIGGDAVMLAALVNTTAKGVMGAAAGGGRFALLYFSAAAFAALVGAAVWFLAGDAFVAMFSST